MEAGPGGLLRIRLCVMGFKSHSTWAEGYARASAHRVTVATVGGDRWKWRMQVLWGGAVRWGCFLRVAGLLAAHHAQGAFSGVFSANLSRQTPIITQVT